MTSKRNHGLTVGKFTDTYREKLQIENLYNQRKLNRKTILSSVQRLYIRSLQKRSDVEENSIQVLGKTVISHINALSRPRREKTFKFLSEQKIAFFILSQDTGTDRDIISHFKEFGLPLLASSIPVNKLITEINKIIKNVLAPMKTYHGVLMDINRLGVLILGKSGIGKSECALDLIIGGSRLIADDVIEIRRTPQSKLVGTGPENIKYLMEIRGIGIVNIKDLFGAASVMDKREIDMVVELDHWNTDTEYERLGTETISYNILDVEIPYVVIPVSPGRNIATVVEVAVRNQILKNSKEYSAIEQIWKY